MQRPHRGLAIYAFLVFATAASGWAQTQTAIAFVDVNVVPMDSERILEHQTVITSGGRIVAMGPSRGTRAPKEAVRVDGRGKFLMPGLADMHVHLNRWGTEGPLQNEDFAVLFLANGVTTVRNMFGHADVLAFRKSIADGDVIGPRIYTTGPITDGSPPDKPANRVAQTVDEAAAMVESDKREGYDAVKIYNRLKADVYQAIVAKARSVSLPVTGHVPNAVGIWNALEARQDSIEHVGGYLEAIDKDDREETRTRLVSETVRAGTWNCPTFTFYQSTVPPSEGAKLLEKPSMQFVPQALRQNWKNNKLLASLTEYQWGRIRLYDQKRRDFVRVLHRGGARLLVGTDTGTPYVVPGFSVHEELANLVGVGLTPFEAIRAATSGPAEFLKARGEWGVVAKGAQADLLLLESNPLEDVANANRRVGVMVRGRWTPEAELRKRLEGMAAKFAR